VGDFDFDSERRTAIIGEIEGMRTFAGLGGCGREARNLSELTAADK